MKFLLLGVVSLAQFQRRQQQRPTYGREDGQYGQHGQQTQQRQVDPFRQGRFGGHTDINRRDQRYINPSTEHHYNEHAGRYGGYTRQYNSQTGHFTGRRDPFRRNTQGTGRGLNIYRHGTEDRMGQLCSQITTQTYERECSTYTGRTGCMDTCARLRAEMEMEQAEHRFGQRTQTQNRNPFGQHRTQTNPFGQHRTQQRTSPFGQHRTQQRTSPFGQHRTQTHHFGQRGQTQQHHYEIPTQGGLFGRRSRTQTHTGYGKQTHGQQTHTQRGFGHNGIFGNRLGQEGHNMMQQHHL